MTPGLLTLAQAQRELGLKGQRGRQLRRILLDKERATGKRIMVRIRGQKRTNLKVTMSAIRRHCPEILPSKVDELSKNFRTYLERIDERIGQRVAEHVSAHVEPQLAELWDRQEQLAENVNDLAATVGKIVGV